MTPEQLSSNLGRVQAEINSTFPQWANVALGNTADAMIQKRIISSGMASDGNKYSAYSTNPTLVGAKSFRTKAAAATIFGNPKKRASQQWVTINRGGANYRLVVLPSGYKQVRQIEGLQVAHKSFLRTGEMWGSIHTLGTRQEGTGRFVTVVGTENPFSNKKLEGHEKREGKPIMMISKSEERELTLILDKYITNILNKAVNG